MITIKIEKKSSTAKKLAFMQNCVSKDMYRIDMSKIFYNKKNDDLVSTDGRRLSIMRQASKNTALSELANAKGDMYCQWVKEGFLICEYSEMLNFPAYHKVIPEKNDMQKLGSINIKKKILSEEIGRITYALDKPFNIDFFKCLYNGEWVLFSLDDNKKPAMLTCGDVDYIVMHLNIIDETKLSRANK